MNNLTLNDLINKLKEYNPDEIDRVTMAYKYAEDLHSGQYRQSGEPYIIHPLNVAYILADMHADGDTICAGLLHDTLEDTNVTKEAISHDFNHDVANLVDGVTKLSKMNFLSKEDQNMANTRKIITSITDDVRIIIIKLADRLHNMRTLQYKSPFKQKENSLETIKLYVPLAYYIGAYRIKSELEDLSLQYLKPDVYKSIGEKKKAVEEKYEGMLVEMLETIQELLNNREIPNEIKIRTKNIYGIYRKLEAGAKMADIHDLLALKIMLEEVEQCYISLGIVHKKYHPINDKFRDYICNPKTNMYQSLHTTVIADDARLVHVQLRTFDMDKVASFGLTAYWDTQKGNARNVMQQELRDNFQFFRALSEINNTFADNQSFIRQVKNELLSANVYVYTTKGDIIELPKGSTIVDFAYKIHTEVGNNMVGAIVNDKEVYFNYELTNGDRVKIIVDEKSSGPRSEWVSMAYTSSAKRKIKEYRRK